MAKIFFLIFVSYIVHELSGYILKVLISVLLFGHAEEGRSKSRLSSVADILSYTTLNYLFFVLNLAL